MILLYLPHTVPVWVYRHTRERILGAKTKPILTHRCLGIAILYYCYDKISVVYFVNTINSNYC